MKPNSRPAIFNNEGIREAYRMLTGDGMKK
jgi:hypothetical protein